MHRTIVTCSRGDSVLVLYIDWSTIQSKEFAQKTVIFCFFFRDVLYSFLWFATSNFHWNASE